MPNGTLTEYLDKRFSYLTVCQRFRLVNDVTSGLCHLHSQKFVHGDLTGSNVLIDGSGRACLTDYDLADIIASSATNMTTSTTSTLHSPDAARWAAPELIPQEDAVDPRPTKSSDVYSFGCIMLQILVGRLPYWWVRRSIHMNNEKAQGTLPMQDDPDVPKLHGRHVVFLKSCWEFLPESRPSSDYAASFVAAELQELERR
jgi:serine/threonine protein kinase